MIPYLDNLTWSAEESGGDTNVFNTAARRMTFGQQLTSRGFDVEIRLPAWSCCSLRGPFSASMPKWSGLWSHVIDVVVTLTGRHDVRRPQSDCRCQLKSSRLYIRLEIFWEAGLSRDYVGLLTESLNGRFHVHGWVIVGIAGAGGEILLS